MLILMIVRGLIGLWFACHFLGESATDWNGLFVLLANYLIIDGCVGIALGGSVYLQATRAGKTHLGGLGAVMFIDAAGRIVFGIAVHVWPGIPGFPVTALMFIVLMAVLTAAAGFADAGIVVEEDVARFGRRHAAAQFAASPVLLSAIVSAGIGVAAVMFAGDRSMLRLLLIGYTTAASLGMFAMAWTRYRMARPESAPR